MGASQFEIYSLSQESKAVPVEACIGTRYTGLDYLHLYFFGRRTGKRGGTYFSTMYK